MRKKQLIPAVAVALGCVGFGLRKWELATAFEPGSGLVTPGMPSTIALILLSIAVAVFFFIAARGRHYSFPGGYSEAFAAKGNSLYMGGMALSAALLLVAAVLKLAEIMDPPQTSISGVVIATQSPLGVFLPLLLIALCVLSAYCVFTVGQSCYRGKPVGKYSFRVLAPAYLCCVWLIAAYQTRAADPIVQDYIYELLAIICALLAGYYMASFSFERPKTSQAMFFSLLTVYFGLVTLADRHDGVTMALYGFSILYMLTCVAALLYQDGRVRLTARGKEVEQSDEDGISVDAFIKEHETEEKPNEES